MQGTELFQKRIKEYLDGKAANDAAFAEKYANGRKSVEECCDFIIGEVQKTKRIGFDDAEIYGLAVHYYDEEECKPNGKHSCRIVCDVAPVLTEEEKAQLAEEAKAEYKQNLIKEMRDKEAAEKEKRAKAEKERKEKEAAMYAQQSLFGD